MATVKVDLKQGATGAWHYREIAGNNKVEAWSETYSDKHEATEAGREKADQLGVPFVADGE